VLVGLTSGQKLGLAVAAGVFIAFALLSAFVFPRRNPDFPGRGLRWFVVVSIILVVSMLTAMAVLAREEEEGEEAIPAETQPSETEPGGTEPAETGPSETEPAETEPAETTGGEGDPGAGEQVFESAGCGACHALSDAGANGMVGPNLDESKPDRELVVERVTNGKGAMPSFRDQLSEEEIANVAAYVAQAADG
jgi:mono/diheme cytochrome c family protein